MAARVSTIALGFLLVLLSALGPTAASQPVDAAVIQQIDEEVPPGNPVIGDDRPGDIEPENDTNYILWIVLAFCLISAGVLLIKIERWEARRVPE